MNDTVPSDDGVYTVVAENKAGSDRTNGRLNIEKDLNIDNKPIVNPDAFNYLNKPDQMTPRSVDQHVKPAKIVVPLSNMRLQEGKPCRLVCKVEGNPLPNVLWFKNGVVLPASNRYTPTFDIKTGVASLKINEAQPSDSANYEVVAENIGGLDRTNSNLIVDVLPSIDKTPIVDPRAFRYLNQPQTPTGAKPEDSKQLNQAPKVIIPLKDLRTNEGQTIQFIAKIVGYPAPRVLWIHNNQPLLDSNRYISSYDHTSGIATFKINGTQVNDTGNYTVVAENVAGQADSTANLSLNPVSLIDSSPIVNPEAFKYLDKPHTQKARPDERDRANYQAPKFVIPLSNVKIDEGQNIKFACKVEGYPKPKITWFKDTKPLFASNRYTTDYDLNTGVVTLKINDAQMNDIGSYYAIAENEAGADQTNCKAFIKQMPSIDRTPMVNPDAFKYLEQPVSDRSKKRDIESMNPPKVIVPLADVKLEEGQTVILACKIEGAPRPKVFFFIVKFSNN